MGKTFFKSTRDGCSESDESNSINGILEENEATQMACNVTDNGSTSTDEENRNDEARITSSQSYQNGSSKKQGQYFCLHFL